MDEKDEIILQILSKNARIPRTKIAEILGISETAVRKRISKLEEEGILLRYMIKINYKALGYSVSLTGIDVEPEKIWEIIDKLKNIKSITSITLTSGDHTIMTKIVSKSVDELFKIHKEIEKLEGVKRICPAIVLDEIK